MKLYIMQFSLISVVLLSAINFYGLISNVPKTRSTVFPQCHKLNITPTVMKMIQKHTYMFMFQISCYQKAGRRAKHYKAVVVSITAN